MKRNGFVFIETIITVVVLSATLLLLYSSYSTIIEKEKQRLYYDDVAALYKTGSIKRILEEKFDLREIKKEVDENNYIWKFGARNNLLVGDDTEKDSLFDMTTMLKARQMALVSVKWMTDCYENNTKCAFPDGFSRGFKNYLNSLNDNDYDYYLVIEYAEKNNDEGNGVICAEVDSINCKYTYASLGI